MTKGTKVHRIQTVMPAHAKTISRRAFPQHYRPMTRMPSNPLILPSRKKIIPPLERPIFVKPAATDFVSILTKEARAFLADPIKKITVYGMALVTLFSFGLIGTSNAQDKTKSKVETVEKSPVLSMNFAKDETKKPADKGYIVKGIPKYDVEYDEDSGILKFKDLDAIYVLSKSVNATIREMSKEPLRVLWHTSSNGVDGVSLVFEGAMIFFAPEVINGKVEFDIEIAVPKEVSQAKTN